MTRVPVRDAAALRRYRFGRLVRGAGMVAAGLLAAYGLWLSLTAGQWLATGLFGLFAYAALTVTRAVACSVEMRD